MFSKYLSLTYRQYQHYMRDKLKEYKIGNSEYPILFCLKSNPKSCQNQVVKLSKLNKSLVSKGVKKLNELEYIKILIDSNHSQRQNLVLTEKGEKLIPKIEKFIMEWEEIIMDGLATEDRKNLYKFMERVEENSIKMR